MKCGLSMSESHWSLCSSFGRMAVSSHAYHANVEPTALCAPDASARSINSSTSLSHFLTPTATLFVAQSNGNLSTLHLTQSNGSYTLSVVSNTCSAGENPSWLTIDSPQRLLYCLDRGHSPSSQGSLTSFRIVEKGSLSKIDSVEAPFSGVAAAYIDLQDGGRGYVCAS